MCKIFLRSACRLNRIAEQLCFQQSQLQAYYPQPLPGPQGTQLEMSEIKQLKLEHSVSM